MHVAPEKHSSARAATYLEENAKIVPLLAQFQQWHGPSRGDTGIFNAVGTIWEGEQKERVIERFIKMLIIVQIGYVAQ